LIDPTPEAEIENLIYLGLPAPITPTNVTAVTGTFAQFIAVVAGRKTAAPSTRSPDLRLGFELLATLPWMSVAPVTDVVWKLMVAPPAGHEAEAVKPLMEPLAQLAVAVTGFGEMVAEPEMNFGTPAAPALPCRQLVRLMVLNEML
jgi:hypothetical protein